MLQPKKQNSENSRKEGLEALLHLVLKSALVNMVSKLQQEVGSLLDRIEAARRAMTRHIKRGGKIWIRIFPDVPITKTNRGKDG